MDTMEGLHRSQYCAEVSEADNGKEVVLTGWVERRRDHGGLIFIDLRDRTGIVQVVASPDYEKVSFDKAEQVRTEYVLAVRGIVRMRDKDTINPKMKTGTIEIRCEELRILNSSKTPPFYIEDNIDVDEKIRLKYRYLDLRRPEMQKNLIMRHKVKHAMRTFLNTVSSTSKRRNSARARQKALVTTSYRAVSTKANSMRCRSRRRFLNSCS